MKHFLIDNATDTPHQCRQQTQTQQKSPSTVSWTAEELWYFRTVSGPEGSKGSKERRELRELFKPSKVMIDGFRQDMLKLGYVVDENMELVEDKNKKQQKHLWSLYSCFYYLSLHLLYMYL